MFEKILGTGGMLEDVEKFTDPAIAPAIGQRVVLLLVGPVRGHTQFGHLVHLPRADLNLDLAAFRANDSRVQRAITVELGGADEILEAARQHGIFGMDAAERGVALAH